jgi:integrative and conjugative element protein (TIGR02256 family)
MSELWISKTALQDLDAEANLAYPLETGGVLVGYIAKNGAPVVFGAIGPGPIAVHRRQRFTPDHAWQCQQLDNVFDKSSGLWVYVGDWHTHPDGSPRMSWLDHRTLRAIAKHRQAEISNPLMLIGGGPPQNRVWTGHQYRSDRLLGLLTDCDQPTLHSF